MRAFAIVLCLLALTGCSKDDPAADFRAQQVKLPDGTRVMAEVAVTALDMQRGMMFRDSLPEGRGMLFLHAQPGRYPYWMYQVKIPLDIVWMDRNGVVVEVSENTPPCQTQASQCPNYGGTKDAQIVLELPGGYGAKHGVRVGARVEL